MLLAEDSEMRMGRDGEYHRWFGCEQGVRNEALDIAVGCMAAIHLLKPNFARLARELAVRKEGDPAPDSHSPDAKPLLPAKRRPFVPQSRPGRSFATGWKR